MSKNKSTNFEINLLPIVSLLAVLISFLLLSTTWVHTSSLDIKQAIGDQVSSNDGAEKKETLWVELSRNQNLTFKIKKEDKTLKTWDVLLNDKKNTVKLIELIVVDYPELKEAFVQPHLKSSYQDVIYLIDNLKKLKINNIGVVPLAMR